MASIIPKEKDGKIVSYKLKSCAGRDDCGEEKIFRYIQAKLRKASCVPVLNVIILCWCKMCDFFTKGVLIK